MMLCDRYGKNYQAYHDGKMNDFIPTDEDLEKGFATIPVVE